MDISFILKIAGIGILVTVCAQVLSRAGREEQASYVTLGGVIVVLFMLVGALSELIETVKEAFML